MSAAEATNASNATQPLSSFQDVALQELWARIIAALGDQSLMPGRPKTSSSGSSRSFPGDYGMAFYSCSDTKTRTYPGMTTDEFRDAFYRHLQGSSPDWVLNHLLRANKFEVEPALQDLFFHLSWRKKIMKVDENLLAHGEAGFVRTLNDPTASKRLKFEAEGFMSILRNGTSRILRGIDRKQRIIIHIRLRTHKGYHYPGTSYLNVSTYFAEYCRLQMGSSIEATVMVIDFADAGLLNMDDRPLRNFIDIARDIYPQGLGDVVMHRMPRTLGPFWAVAKRLLRPEFVSHIHFTRTVADLEEFIPRDVLPTELGGTDDFNFDYVEPDLDDPLNGGGGEAVQAAMRAERDRLLAERRVICDEYMEMTKRWIEVARSGRDPSEMQAMRKKVSDEIVASYWKLDPFLRARSIFDKYGMLPEPDIDYAKLMAAVA